MTSPSLLAALGAVFAPELAAAALARAPDPVLATEAVRLVPLPRPRRLAALARALAAQGSPPPHELEVAAAAERPRVAALLRTGRGGLSPLMSRLVLERRGSGSGSDSGSGSEVRPPHAPSAARTERRK